MAEGRKPHTNRLVNEKSPYLLQHAHNPVDWYAWSEEAFDRARQEEKPVFLSIGYSTCHWCHVMEKESFSDPGVAEMMNRHFVCVKVDREERPDVDKVYMDAVVAMTGRGGWPLTAFLTPDKKPFFGGTYFPPDDRLGMTGLKTILRSVSQAWAERREQLLRSGDSLVEFMRRQARAGNGATTTLGEAALASAYVHLSENFDSRFGGFGPAPKFPTPHSLGFLLRYWKRTGEARALDMVESTLVAMAEGGMYDHLGGGFHRYSTDAEWHVPHFEKMLYDQATLSRVYLEAYQATRNSRYAATATEVLDYVLRDMTSDTGGFYSAEDADSAVSAEQPEKKREGAFYVWSEAEIMDSLGEHDGPFFLHHFGVEGKGNVARDPGGEFTGKNILRVTHSTEETAQRFAAAEHEVEDVLERSKRRLREVRSRRTRPHLDDK
ncbi:MAG: thioredoxin domain-containing protein, partial [Candidatus Eiseniibacteriota bacterium]